VKNNIRKRKKSFDRKRKKIQSVLHELLALIFEILGINDIAEIVESGVKHHKPARLGINLKY
jgi:hypothetical protein